MIDQNNIYTNVHLITNTNYYFLLQNYVINMIYLNILLLGVKV